MRGLWHTCGGQRTAFGRPLLLPWRMWDWTLPWRMWDWTHVISLGCSCLCFASLHVGLRMTVFRTLQWHTHAIFFLLSFFFFHWHRNRGSWLFHRKLPEGLLLIRNLVIHHWKIRVGWVFQGLARSSQMPALCVLAEVTHAPEQPPCRTSNWYGLVASAWSPLLWVPPAVPLQPAFLPFVTWLLDTPALPWERAGKFPHALEPSS